MLDSLQFKEEQRQKVVVLQPQLQPRPQVQIKLPTEPDKGVAEMLNKKRQRKSESNNNNEGEGTASFSAPMSRPPSLQILLQVFTIGLVRAQVVIMFLLRLRNIFSALITVGGFSYPIIDDNSGRNPVYDIEDSTSSNSTPRRSKADCRPYNDLCHILFHIDAAAPFTDSIHFKSAVDIVRNSKGGLTSKK